MSRKIKPPRRKLRVKGLSASGYSEGFTAGMQSGVRQNMRLECLREAQRTNGLNGMQPLSPRELVTAARTFFAFVKDDL